MAKARKVSSSSPPQGGWTAISPGARENQLVSLAVDLAEQQLRDGTASSQVITHFLKLGTEKARLEREKLEYETEHLKAKTAAIQSQQRSEEMIERAMKAFRRYSGQGDPDEYEY